MIIPYNTRLYGIDLNLLVEIEELSIGNDGVGWTQYGSHWSFDHDHDYIEDYSIEAISINTVDGWKPIPMTSNLAKRLCMHIFESDEFTEAIWKEIEAIRRDAIIEKQLEQRLWNHAY